jgi:hypothetical protein
VKSKNDVKHYLDVIYQDFQGVGSELVDLLDVFPEQEGLVSVGIVDQFVVRYLKRSFLHFILENIRFRERAQALKPLLIFNLQFFWLFYSMKF